jgi:2-C-methyl-D-erythritol 4-phosphate cytidylyltransferase
MVEWSVAAFRAASVEVVVVACPPGHALGESEAGQGELRVVEGGETRSQSVGNALAEVGTELVAIHDAARPLVTPALIEEVVDALLAEPDAAGAIAATPVTDTVKQAVQPAQNDPPLAVESTLDRSRLWAAQTPQVFRTDTLRGALEPGGDAVASATDESMLIEAAGGRVLICPAPPENLKVTTPRDLRLAEQLLEERRADEEDGRSAK